tara:strand:- start:189 stop:572 length:384 start_codon:yes stop_codon:yes gene_type:complete
MAHFAKLGEGNIVEDVIVVNNDVLLDKNGVEQEQLGIDFLHKLFGSNTTWVQTSYNANFRGNFAGKGYTYLQGRDKFISSRPYNSNGVFKSWYLSDETGDWTPPVERPNDGKNYKWNEQDQTWDLIE